MRSLPVLAAALGSVLMAHAAAAQSAATASVVVTAQFTSRTVLRVSSEVLRFHLSDSERAPIVAVDFSAAARTQSGGEVVLAIEPVRALEGPGGAADVESTVSFVGQGEGTLSGTLDAAASAIAARWTGSGMRQGRVAFSVHASTPGHYTVPVRFVLTAP